MSQVNLLPPELRQRQVVKRQTTLIAAVGVGLLALIAVFYFFQTVRLSSARETLAAQEATNADLQSQISELQPFADLQSELEAKQELVSTVFLNELSWYGVLLDVSRVIPDDSYLTNFAGQLTVTTGGVVGEPAAGAASLIGNMTFQGVADETETIADWLTKLEQVKGWVNPWVNSATETGAFTRIYAFDSGIDLTIEAVTARGSGGKR